jgi:CO/xanthine dehydrogenase Mo-binding subunit
VLVLGAKGIRESPILAGLVALANAIYDASSMRVGEVPINAEKL